MKKLLLTLLLASASLHAMEHKDLTYIEYDPTQKYALKVQNIFSEAFGGADLDPVFINTPTSLNAHITVLKENGKTVGFAIWEREILTKHQAFNDIYNPTHNRTHFNIVRILHIAIHKNHRHTDTRAGKGLCSSLLHYIREKANEYETDVISLHAAYGSRPFYEKNGFINTLPRQLSIDRMALPLNDTMKEILREVIAKREENYEQQKSTLLNKNFI